MGLYFREHLFPYYLLDHKRHRYYYSRLYVCKGLGYYGRTRHTRKEENVASVAELEQELDDMPYMCAIGSMLTGVEPLGTCVPSIFNVKSRFPQSAR